MALVKKIKTCKNDDFYYSGIWMGIKLINHLLTRVTFRSIARLLVFRSMSLPCFYSLMLTIFRFD